MHSGRPTNILLLVLQMIFCVVHRAGTLRHSEHFRGEGTAVHIKAMLTTAFEIQNLIKTLKAVATSSLIVGHNVTRLRVSCEQMTPS